MIGCYGNISIEKPVVCGLPYFRYENKGYSITFEQAKKLVSKGEIIIKRAGKKVKLILDLPDSEKNKIIQTLRP